MAVAHRPADSWLTRGAAATEGEFAGRLGLPSAPAMAERIGLERDLALAELTGALAGIPHLRRLRIHSRLPVVLPARVDAALLDWL
ncbi:MAG TPA: hypothetical protein PLO65_16510, partial [Caulobacter sp.]|nr:hypothetical protein [Caulobacter sp.]